MQLKKLVIENLRSYENQEVIFPDGSTLLSGDIGSGKTTILLAVEFALFGLQPSQKANSLLRNNKDNGKVLLEFEVDGKNVQIERTLKRGKKTISQDYVSITIDDDKYEESVSEVKSKILNLLNYPSEFSKKTNLLYKFTVYTPQEEMKQIITESKEIRLNTLRHVFGIDKYKRIQENTKILSSKLREKIRINNALLGDIDEIKENLENKKKLLIEEKDKSIISDIEYKKALESRESKEKDIKLIQGKIDEKRDLENEKSKSEILVSEKKHQIKSHENNIVLLKQQISEVEALKFDEEEYKALETRIEFQKNKEKELEEEYMDIMGKIKSFESKKIEAQSLANKITGLENCPTCMQNVSEEYKNNIINNANAESKNLDKQKDEIEKRKKDLMEKIEVVKKLKDDFQKKRINMDLIRVKLENINDKEKRIVEIESQKISLEKDVEMLVKHLNTLIESIKEYEKYDIIFKEKNLEIIDAKNEENQAAIKKAEINKEVGFLEQQIRDIEESILKKEILKKHNERLKELEFWVTQKFLEIVLFTEKQVMLALRNEFSELFSKWFSILVSDSLTATLDEDFTPKIEQQDYELDYSFLSGGERTAIALAYRLSLNQVINSLLSNIKTSDLVILDEPTDGFSTQQLDKMRDILEQLDIGQLILVSHEQKVEGFVDNIIRISKDKNISKVE